MTLDELRALEHEYERAAARIGFVIAKRPRSSAWLPPSRDAFMQAAAACAMARNASEPAAAELVDVAESFARIGAAYERLAG